MNLCIRFYSFHNNLHMRCVRIALQHMRSPSMMLKSFGIAAEDIDDLSFIGQESLCQIKLFS